MNVLFKENYCRICYNCFCCELCRLQHEQKFHNVDPNCEICIYGRTFLKVPTESILSHWKGQHWPLHCILCKKVFKTQQDIGMHTKCTNALNFIENSSMVLTSLSDINYDSPPISAPNYTSNKQNGFSNNIISVTTSTPMDKYNEMELLEDISQGMTPVDYSSGSVEVYEKVGSIASTKSQFTSINEESKSTKSPKRRVTFCETPIITCEKDKSSIREADSQSFKCDMNRSSEMFMTPGRQKSYNFIKTSLNNDTSKFEEERADSEKRSKVNIPPDEIKQEDIIEDEGQSFKDGMDTSSIEIFMTPGLPENCVFSQKSFNNDIVKFEEKHVDGEKMVPTSEVKILPDKIKEVINGANCPSFTNDMDISTNIFMTPELQQSYVFAKTSFNNGISKFAEDRADCEKILVISEVTMPPDKVNDEGIIKFKEECSTSAVNVMESVSIIPEKQGIWCSMANIVKNAIKGFSESTRTYKKLDIDKENLEMVPESDTLPIRRSNKRSKPDTEPSVEETPIIKRIKLSDIKCRKAINHLRVLYKNQKRVRSVDKGTQTD